jgi:hypothetical protein
VYRLKLIKSLHGCMCGFRERWMKSFDCENKSEINVFCCMLTPIYISYHYYKTPAYPHLHGILLNNLKLLVFFYFISFILPQNKTRLSTIVGWYLVLTIFQTKRTKRYPLVILLMILYSFFTIILVFCCVHTLCSNYL